MLEQLKLLFMLKLHKNIKGFSLVELIMTIVVISIVAIPVSLLLTEHIRSVVYSQDITVALNLARMEMEKVNNLSYASISSASYANYSGYAYDVTRTVTYAQGNAGSAESLKKIIVEVKKAGSATVITTLTTYLAKNVSFGL